MKKNVIILTCVLVIIVIIVSLSCAAPTSQTAEVPEEIEELFQEEVEEAEEAVEEDVEEIEGEAAEEAEEVLIPQDLIIGFSQLRMNAPYRVAMVEQLEAEIKARNYNWELTVTDADDKSEKQISDVEDLMAKGCDVIVLCPNQAEPLTNIATDVYRSGIPIIISDRWVIGDNFTAFVGGNSVYGSKQIGLDIAKKFDEAKIVELMGNLGGSATLDRSAGLRQGIEGNPDLEIIVSLTGEFRRDIGMSVMEDILESQPEIDVVVAQNDNMALGALTAIESVGREDEILVYGYDGVVEIFDAIRQGRIEGTSLYPTGAAETVDLIEKILTDQPFEKYNKLPCPFVTIENVDEYEKYAF